MIYQRLFNDCSRIGFCLLQQRRFDDCAAAEGVCDFKIVCLVIADEGVW